MLLFKALLKTHLSSLAFDPSMTQNMILVGLFGAFLPSWLLIQVVSRGGAFFVSPARFVHVKASHAAPSNKKAVRLRHDKIETTR